MLEVIIPAKPPRRGDRLPPYIPGTVIATASVYETYRKCVVGGAVLHVFHLGEGEYCDDEREEE